VKLLAPASSGVSPPTNRFVFLTIERCNNNISQLIDEPHFGLKYPKNAGSKSFETIGFTE